MSARRRCPSRISQCCSAAAKRTEAATKLSPSCGGAERETKRTERLWSVSGCDAGRLGGAHSMTSSCCAFSPPCSSTMNAARARAAAARGRQFPRFGAAVDAAAVDTGACLVPSAPSRMTVAPSENFGAQPFFTLQHPTARDNKCPDETINPKFFHVMLVFFM
eukprot:5166170-Pleurochrysis_carterae.AAC.1